MQLRSSYNKGLLVCIVLIGGNTHIKIYCFILSYILLNQWARELLGEAVDEIFKKLLLKFLETMLKPP